MHKRVFALCLCAVLFLSLLLPAFAAEESGETAAIAISTAEEFLTFAENCRLDAYSRNLTVSLEADIDLSGREFESIPMFSGTLEGNGHTIMGLSLSAEGSAQGLFRYLTEASVVQNLVLEGDIHPEGSRSQIGGIAGSSDGQILNCSYRGSLSGGD